jgi:hypothetical protein
MEEKLGKKARRLRSERHACLRRGKAEAVEAVLSRCQTERSRKAFWNAEQSDRHLASREGTRIASQPLLPRESSVAPVAHGKGAKVRHPGWPSRPVRPALRGVGRAGAACTRVDVADGSSPSRGGEQNR